MQWQRQRVGGDEKGDGQRMAIAFIAVYGWEDTQMAGVRERKKERGC